MLRNVMEDGGGDGRTKDRESSLQYVILTLLTLYMTFHSLFIIFIYKTISSFPGLGGWLIWELKVMGEDDCGWTPQEENPLFGGQNITPLLVILILYYKYRMKKKFSKCS